MCSESSVTSNKEGHLLDQRVNLDFASDGSEIIELCVRWYITYRLSYRDLVAMMAERGIVVWHTTIHRWVIRYVPEF
jgi:hypothetical protein